MKLMIAERQAKNKRSSANAPANSLELGHAGGGPRGAQWTLSWESRKTKVNRVCRTEYWKGENCTQRTF